MQVVDGASIALWRGGVVRLLGEGTPITSLSGVGRYRGFQVGLGRLAASFPGCEGRLLLRKYREGISTRPVGSMEICMEGSSHPQASPPDHRGVSRPLPSRQCGTGHLSGCMHMAAGHRFSPSGQAGLRLRRVDDVGRSLCSSPVKPREVSLHAL